MRSVAVTGGLSAGKTSVCTILEQLGAKVESADRIVHELLIPSSPLGQRICELLGEEVLAEHGFSRDAIARRVFNNRPLLEQLEAILHPEVRKEIARRAKGDAPLYVVEVPLLFEAGFDEDFDATVAVVADEESCRRRFGDGYDERMAHQLSMEEKAARADYVIENRGDLEQLRQAVESLFQTLTQ